MGRSSREASEISVLHAFSAALRRVGGICQDHRSKGFDLGKVLGKAVSEETLTALAYEP